MKKNKKNNIIKSKSSNKKILKNSDSIKSNILDTRPIDEDSHSSDEIDVFQHLNALLEERENDSTKTKVQNDNSLLEEGDLTSDSLDTNIIDIITKDNEIYENPKNEVDEETNIDKGTYTEAKKNHKFEEDFLDDYINESKQKNKSEIASECSRLALEKKWNELTNYTENATQSAQGEDLYFARLWWITAQIEANSMPLGILAGPLDTVSKEVIEGKSELSNDLLYLTEGTLINVAKKLFVTDLDMANLFYERAIKINPTHTSDFVNILKKELDDFLLAPQTKINTDKIAYLKEKIAEYGASIKTNIQKNEERLDNKIVLDSTFNNSDLITSDNHPEKNSARLGFFILLILLAFFSFFLSRNYPELLFKYLGIKQIQSLFSSSKKNDVVLYSENFLPVNFKEEELVLPEILPINVPRRDSIGGVLRELNNSSIKPSQNEKINLGEILDNKSEDEVNEIILAGLINTQKMKNQDVTGNDSVKSSGVNTQSPVEPEELKELVNKAESGELNLADNSSNKDDADKFDRVTKPIVGGHSKTDPIVPAYMVPQNTVKGTEMYEINGYAEVLSEPSSRRGAKVATLISGDRIRVESFKGDWVKIVSQSGRPGYIQKSALGRRVLDINDSFRQ